MNFGEQIRRIRTERQMTQEQFAEKLGVTRQAVSNWENDRNLPDIEMLISISLVFHISLDYLILGGANMNNMAEKLIQDGSETKRAKYNYIGIGIGAGLLIIGVFLLLFKAFSPNYLDTAGYLHEDNFILIPIAFLFIVSGVISFLTIGIKNIAATLKSKDDSNRKRYIIISSVCTGIVVIFVIMFILLMKSNS